MVGVRINDPDAKQLLKSRTVLKDVGVSRDKSLALALVRRIHVKRISSVAWANDLDYSR